MACATGTVLALVGLGAGPAPAQAPATEDLDATIQILEAQQTEDGVSVVVAVPARTGALPSTVDSFGIYDGGPADLSVGRIADSVDVVIAMDTSQSMENAPLAAAKRAALAFVDRLGSEDRVGLVSFGETVTVEAPLATDRQPVVDELTALSTYGETALWDGLVTSAALLEATDEPFVVVLSDGENTAGSAGEDEAVSALRSIGARLYAVGIEGSEEDLDALQRAAEAVGGHYLDTTDIADLEAFYTDIAGRLSNRYLLTYPTARQDRREIVVSLAIGDGRVATERVLVGDEPGATTTTVEPAEHPPVGSDSTTGDDAVDDAAPAPALDVPGGPSLGPVAGTGSELLADPRVLWVGAAAFFGAFALVGLLVVAPAAEIRFPSASGADRVAGVKSRLSAVADRLIATRDEDGAIDEALDTAGIELRPGEFLLLGLTTTIVAGLVAWTVLGPPAGLGALLLLPVGFVLYVRTRVRRRRRQFGDQLVDALTILAGGLRAGRGILQAIELVSQEAPSPTREQFGRVVFETRIGRDMVDSLTDIAHRMRNRELEWVGRAIDINRELGGDLIETLGNVTDTIRDRKRVERQVQALAAEGRASGWLMLALPPAMFLFLVWRTPETATLLFTDPTGRFLLAIGVLGLVVGAFWIRKLVDLRY